MSPGQGAPHQAVHADLPLNIDSQCISLQIHAPAGLARARGGAERGDQSEDMRGQHARPRAAAVAGQRSTSESCAAAGAETVLCGQSGDAAPAGEVSIVHMRRGSSAEPGEQFYIRELNRKYQQRHRDRIKVRLRCLGLQRLCSKAKCTCAKKRTLVSWKS